VRYCLGTREGSLGGCGFGGRIEDFGLRRWGYVTRDSVSRATLKALHARLVVVWDGW
jgi:hypothetical protein